MTRGVLLILAALLLAGCDTARGLLGAPTMRLQVTGPDVTVNGSPAQDGQRLLEGQRLRTGARSAARIYWSDGTWLQVNPNSDPVCVFLEDRGYYKCTILFGAFYVDTAGRKLWVEHSLASAILGSEAAFYAERDTRFTATLLGGEMRLIAPQTRALRPGETVTVVRGQAPQISPTPPALLAQIEADFGRWASLLRRERFDRDSDSNTGNDSDRDTDNNNTNDRNDGGENNQSSPGTDNNTGPQ